MPLDQKSVMPETFQVTVEVVPPTGPDVGRLLNALQGVATQPVNAFSVATNPVARPRMSALATCALIQQQLGKPAILHCTTRDHNYLSLQGLLWGAQALEITTVLVMTGDFVALKDRQHITTVRDSDVFDLIALARSIGLQTGVVFGYPAEPQKRNHAIRRLEQKIEAGAQFVVTQPVYDAENATAIVNIGKQFEIPIILGILPLWTARHAEFLHQKVAGIEIPQTLRERMARASAPRAEGIRNARDMFAWAHQHCAGVCVMPPFNHYEIVSMILSN